jgi:hypothetical protein
MKTAILLTGGYRTFEICYKTLIKHILLPNEAKAFILLDGKKEEELRIRELLGEDYIGDIFQVSTSRDKNFQAICEYLAKTKPAIQANVFAKVGWSQSYVFNSGSILEYYQYMKCFDMMVDYEKRNDIAFDIVLRSRLDIVVGQPSYQNISCIDNTQV